jgi:hypothetical protein
MAFISLYLQQQLKDANVETYGALQEGRVTRPFLPLSRENR